MDRTQLNLIFWASTSIFFLDFWFWEFHAILVLIGGSPSGGEWQVEVSLLKQASLNIFLPRSFRMELLKMETTYWPSAKFGSGAWALSRYVTNFLAVQISR